MAEMNLQPIEAMTPTEARAQMEATAQARKAEPLPVARVEERLIPGPAGDIRLRLYWPYAAAPLPAIVYYHGGGHVIGSLDTHDLVADADRIGVHGDSAGANLAAVVALMARDAGSPRLRLQSLVYPVADYGLIGNSYDKFAEGYGLLTKDAMVWFRDHYLRTPKDAEDWRASPIKASNFEGVAPAIVVTAECDVLHDEGER